MFDDGDEDEEKPQSIFAAIFGARARDDAGDEDTDDDDDEDHRRGPNWIAIGVILLVVGLVGGVIGYWIMGDDGVNERPKTAAAVVSMAIPPRPGTDQAGAGLITPPKGESDVASTDRSTSRRPWLNSGGAESPKDAPTGDGKSKPTEAKNPDTKPAAPEQPKQPPREETADPGTEGAESTSGEAPAASPVSGERAKERLKVKEPVAPTASTEQDVRIPDFEDLPSPPKSAALAAAPAHGLTSKTDRGLLPIIGPEGNTSWKAYRRPFKNEKTRGRVAIIVTELGLRREATEAAIERLPAEVTLSFSPYADGLKRWVERARARGHEVLIDMPMEPANFPVQDPGPYGLLTVLSPQENIDRLETVLSRTTGYVGIVAHMGSRFLTMPSHFLPILMTLNQRGLIYVDNGATGTGLIIGGAPQGLPHGIADVTIDERPFAASITARLDALTVQARTARRAIGLASPYPVTMDRLVVWIASLEGKGVTLVPLSAAVQGLPEEK